MSERAAAGVKSVNGVRSPSVRVPLAGIASLIVLGGLQPFHAQQPIESGNRAQVCGTVIGASCGGAKPPTIQVVVDQVTAVVVIGSDERDAARERASQLVHRRVCASGILKQKGTAFLAPRLDVASIDDITPAAGDLANDWVRPGVHRTCDAGVELPELKKASRPDYTRAAMSARIQGTVWVEAVVDIDGRVRETRVIRSLDPRHGLDDEAVKAARRWRFIPGTKDGQPAPVLVLIELSFTLRDTPP